MKRILIKGAPGIPNLIARFEGRTVFEIEFVHRKPHLHSPSLLNKDEKTLVVKLNKDIQAYFKGEEVDFRKYKVSPDRGTVFQRKVWQILRTIPYGESSTYKWISAKIGKPKSARAVGRACGANPILILQPCHRIASSKKGSIGGFSGGIRLKRKLLTLEGIIE